MCEKMPILVWSISINIIFLVLISDLKTNRYNFHYIFSFEGQISTNDYTCLKDLHCPSQKHYIYIGINFTGAWKDLHKENMRQEPYVC